MRPAVKRRLVTLAAAASLLLCVAMVALWVRSYKTQDSLRTLAQPGESSLFAGSLRGVVAIGYVRASARILRRWSSEPVITGSTFATEQLWGFGYERASWGWAVTTPIAAILIMQLLLFAALLAPLLRPRGTPLHTCPTCGYDLRATPERCPECGTSVSTA